MLTLLLSLGGLGLAAVDPIGIACMPLLLAQSNPYRRVSAFLLGSFISITVLGLLFARGLGQRVLRYEHLHHFVVPRAEKIAATLLLLIAIVLFIQVLTGRTNTAPSSRTQKWLTLSNWHVLGLGAILVSIQSTIDIVFVLAMIRTGQFHLSNLSLLLAVTVYALAALLLQIAIVVLFRLAPEAKKHDLLRRIHLSAQRYGTQAVIVIGLGLSCLLFVLAA